MGYTVGNWTVESLTTDTVATTKTLDVPDLSYATDYSVSQRKPTEIRLANTTGTSLLTVEQLRYGRRIVNNVYNNTDVPETQQCNVKQGVATLCEVRYLLKATNSVSGQEILLPVRGGVTLQVPTVDFITANALESLLMRTVACALATGLSDGSLVTAVARGDLDPTA